MFFVRYEQIHRFKVFSHQDAIHIVDKKTRAVFRCEDGKCRRYFYYGPKFFIYDPLPDFSSSPLKDVPLLSEEDREYFESAKTYKAIESDAPSAKKKSGSYKKELEDTAKSAAASIAKDPRTYVDIANQYEKRKDKKGG
ncbi:MAG: hypothetical protein H6850_03205 [Alphaproteobacteria bacterium]|nr:MAG: hypothetical protein H6850_03205 [Alphaproteobacteria bacterium]